MPISNQTSDPVARALGELAPGTRALLDLSLRRALPDEELAKLVAADPGEIALRRERALDGIAAEAGIDGPEARDQVSARLLAAPSEVWLASAGPGRPEAPKPVAAAPRAPIKAARQTVVTSPGASLGPPPGHVPPAPIGGPRTQPGAAQPPTRNRNRVMGLLALLLAAALVAVLLLQLAGSSDEAAPGPGPTPDAPAEPMPTGGPAAAEDKQLAGQPLEGLPGAGGPGSVAVRLEGGETIVATLDGLPEPGRDVYELWLYNSILDSEGLGTTGSPSGSIEARLPANANDYRFLDLTMQPRNQTSVHNGRSLFRTPLSRVEQA